MQGSLDNINLFSCITIISFFLLLPVALLTEGVRFTPAAMRASGLEPAIVMKKAVIAAMCFHAYQQVFICKALALVCNGAGGSLWSKQVYDEHQTDNVANRIDLSENYEIRTHPCYF